MTQIRPAYDEWDDDFDDSIVGQDYEGNID